MILASVDDSAVTIKLQKLEQAITEGVPKAQMDLGFELLRLSQFEVPHDEGSLQNSGVVELDGEDVAVGYREPYAARLHENPQYNFQKGRKGKYLEDPILNNKDVFVQQFGLHMEEELKRAL